MRIIEEEDLPQHQPMEGEIVPAKQSVKEPRVIKRKKEADGEIEELDDGIKKAKRRQLRSLNQHSCLKLMGCFVLMLLTIFLAVGYLVIFVAGPIVKKVDELPKDFPKSLTLYQVEKAKIKVQNPDGKAKAAQLIRALPSWVLNPFVGYLSTELKTQVLSSGQTSTSTEGANLADLEKALSNQTKTVSLSWSNLNKTKEDLFSYYKNQLKANGFEVKENISDYEIDLSFIREGVSGAITIADSFMNDDGALMKMTINYLTGN